MQVSCDIAYCYYLYRHKFKFVSQTPGIEIAEPSLPAGEPQQDREFGNVDVYREHVEIPLHFRRLAEAQKDMAVEVTFQGCADIGVCYMPMRKTVSFELGNTKQTSAESAPD